MAEQQFHELTVAAVRPQTAHAKAIRFELPDALKAEFAFKPGQYLTLRTKLNGEDVRRSYSICCAPGEGLEIGVKHVEGGAFSSFAQGLKPGDRIEVAPPHGRFTAEPGHDWHFLMIAAGSGITPVLSIVKSVLAGNRAAHITLIYANRNVDSVMFRAELDALKDTYLTRLNLLHVLSEEDEDAEILSGRVDAAKLADMQARKLIDISAYDAAYLCGPAPMTKALRAALTDMGMPLENIRFEIFTPTPYGKPSGEHVAVKASVAGADVEVILDGTRRKLKVDPANETVLGAAQRDGVEIPYSCAGGMCCTCRCKVVEGKASMDQNWSLQPWELEAGFILACQARPETDKLVLDFDAQ
jgi:ring-1,2-phenylacetyl-CoA epoxidase subunit PaaE